MVSRSTRWCFWGEKGTHWELSWLPRRFGPGVPRWKGGPGQGRNQKDFAKGNWKKEDEEKTSEKKERGGRRWRWQGWRWQGLVWNWKKETISKVPLSWHQLWSKLSQRGCLKTIMSQGWNILLLLDHFQASQMSHILECHPQDHNKVILVEYNQRKDCLNYWPTFVASKENIEIIAKGDGGLVKVFRTRLLSCVQARSHD